MAVLTDPDVWAAMQTTAHFVFWTILLQTLIGFALAYLIDRKFFAAGAWSLVGAFCAGIGLTHSYQLNGNIVDFLFAFARPALETSLIYRSWNTAAGYLLMSAAFFSFGVYFQRKGEMERVTH